jgi:hypothetical protein
MRYYAGIVDNDGHLMMTPTGPYDGHDDVMARHVREVSLQSPRFNVTTGMMEPPKYARRVLVDTGSLDVANEAELQQLLHTDPALRALFELGRNWGLREAGQQRR